MFAEICNSVDLGHLAILGFCLAIAFGFEVINGFHDAANAVATVIYTKSLRPAWAVILAGLANLLGVLCGGTAVAFSIVHLLPVDLLVDMQTMHGLTVVLALLVSAVLWNLGTWYLGLPASSSHTLVGSILGVALTHGMLSGKPFGAGVNWSKLWEVGLSLLISPLLGFALAAALLLMAKRLCKSESLFRAPSGDRPPPATIRTLLVGSCAGVSFAHGSNDGQKGMGLIMLILIGLLPAHFALNGQQAGQCAHTCAAAVELRSMVKEGTSDLGRASERKPDVRFDSRARRAYAPTLASEMPVSSLTLPLGMTTPVVPQLPGPSGSKNLESQPTATDQLQASLDQIIAELGGKQVFAEIPIADRWRMRTSLLELNHSLVAYSASMSPSWTATEHQRFESLRLDVRQAIDYVPWWIVVMVALCLGLGGMVGWKRVVVTVGEKIGKSHLTYAQGVSAQLVAMSTIGLADLEGLPVSTTHVLSSGVAGSSIASGCGLNFATIRSILLAWVLTLPAAMLLSSLLLILSRVWLG